MAIDIVHAIVGSELGREENLDAILLRGVDQRLVHYINTRPVQNIDNDIDALQRRF